MKPSLEEATSLEGGEIRGWANVVWGLGGILAFLVYAVYRLAGKFFEALDFSFTGPQWMLLVVNTAFMAYSEGYKGFHKSFAPRVVARALTLRSPAPRLRVLLAPLFCMGYFHTTRRRLLGTYALTVGIVILIVLFQYLPQPWRGILDFGVVVGLSWGTASILLFIDRALFRGGLEVSPEISTG